MSVGLNGNLRDFGISEVFQLIGQQRKTGTLRVREGVREFELRFDEGRVVTAAPAEAPGVAIGDMLVRCGVVAADVFRKARRSKEPEECVEDALLRQGHLSPDALRATEDLLTRETLFDLLRWVDGSFHFVAEAVRHGRSADALLPAEQVLMDGLRMVDEWSAFERQAPASTVVLRRRGNAEEFRASQAATTSGAEKIYLLVDGRSPVSRVIDLSQLGTFSATRVLVDLMRAGWVEAIGGRRQGTMRGAAARLRPRLLLANAIPFLLLGVLALGVDRPRADPEPGIISLRRDMVFEAKQRFAAVRMRNLVEAYRLVEGEWPTRIQPLQLWAASAGALTPLESGPYYFRQREWGPVLLAPEPSPSFGAHSGRAR